MGQARVYSGYIHLCNPQTEVSGHSLQKSHTDYSQWGKKSLTFPAAHVLTKPPKERLCVVIIAHGYAFCSWRISPCTLTLFLLYALAKLTRRTPWSTGAMFSLAVVPFLISTLNNATLCTEILGKVRKKSSLDARSSSCHRKGSVTISCPSVSSSVHFCSPLIFPSYTSFIVF